MVNRDWLPPTVVFRMRTINNLLPQLFWSARDVTAGMLVVKNKIFSLVWELNSNSILLTPSMGASESLFYHFLGTRITFLSQLKRDRNLIFPCLEAVRVLNTFLFESAAGIWIGIHIQPGHQKGACHYRRESCSAVSSPG